MMKDKSADYPRQFFTFADKARGYRKTRAALRKVSDQALKTSCLESNKSSFDAVFGRAAREYGNIIVAELKRRGIKSVPNIFGPIKVKEFRSNPIRRRKSRYRVRKNSQRIWMKLVKGRLYKKSGKGRWKSWSLSKRKRRR